ncbi:MAG: hypothetical protein IKQ70_16270 [Bacteroidales bacterium]|nr:hypothetical protein [Bacteroidales bacterium]
MKFISTKLILLLFLGSLIFTSCNSTTTNGNDSSTNQKEIIDLVKRFNDEGLKADTVETMLYQFIGACSGYRVDVNGEPIEIYKYDLSDKGQKTIADEIENSGIVTVGSFKNPALYSNGFVIISYESHPDRDKIKEILNNF